MAMIPMIAAIAAMNTVNAAALTARIVSNSSRNQTISLITKKGEDKEKEDK